MEERLVLRLMRNKVGQSARIAVIGMSHGGKTVLEAIKQSTSDGATMKPFRAAIALKGVKDRFVDIWETEKGATGSTR